MQKMKQAWLGLVGCLWCCVAGASLDSKYQKQQEAEARERAAQATPLPKREVRKPVSLPRKRPQLTGDALNDLFESDMVSIPAGSFVMGCQDGRDENCDKDEKPAHKVQISAFQLGKTEVTQGQWKAVMGSNPSNFSSCGDTCPVEKVSWDDIQTFIQKLNAQTGKTYRLPTEAEWEYACRAGQNTQYCGGNDANAVAWYEGNSGNKTHPVAGKQANAWGLYDMSGNVTEWVQDSYHDTYSNAPSDGSAWEKGGDEKKVVRGGSWGYPHGLARCAFRGWSRPGGRYGAVGFRVVLRFSPVSSGL
jgi:formylglycine-generating enzyme required for sulfatase activity